MEGSTLKMIMIQGPREGETLEFKPKTEIRIGRVVRGNTLPIKDAGISSKHLSVDFESGKWVIRDLDSSNGTLLNGSKLPPFTPFDLGDGDAIKIGESTSIEVKIEDVGESRLRRNPRRLATKNVGSVAKNQGRRGPSKRGKGLEEEDSEAKLGLLSENCEQQLENVGSVAENRGQRGGSRRGKGLKAKDIEAKSGLVSENREQQLENVVSVAENRGGRGGLRRGKGLNEKDGEAKLGLISENCDLTLENVGSVAENRGQRGGSRRGKVLKEEDNAADLELVGVKCEEELEDMVVVTKNQRRRCRPKRAKVQNLEGQGNVSPLAEETGQQVRLRRTGSPKEEEQLISHLGLHKIPESSSLDCGELEIADKRTQGGLRRNRNLEDEASVVVEVVDSEDKNVEGLDLGRDACKKSASGAGVKEVSDQVDLEKMTLGEWFDYIEVFLPKQICDVTEEMIKSMRQKDERFREFIIQQQNEKGKLPLD